MSGPGTMEFRPASPFRRIAVAERQLKWLVAGRRPPQCLALPLLGQGGRLARMPPSRARLYKGRRGLGVCRWNQMRTSLYGVRPGTPRGLICRCFRHRAGQSGNGVYGTLLVGQGDFSEEPATGVKPRDIERERTALGIR